MASRRGDGIERVKQLQTLFEPFYGKKVQFSFPGRSFPITITGVSLARLADLENKPEQRHDGEKKYTPPVMTLETAEGRIYFVLEDIEVFPQLKGLLIKTVANDIRIEG